MRLPQNGSPAANAMWAVCGAVAGTTLTWWTVPRPGGPDGFGHVPDTRSSVRDAALQVRADDRPLSQNKSAIPPKLRDALERGEHFRRAGAEAARENVAGALDEAYAIENRQDQLDFYRGLYGIWSEEDPSGAAGHAQASLPAGQLQSDAIGIAVNKWAENSPREAWLWAEQNLTGPLKERALTDLMVGWSRRSPQQAAEWLQITGVTSQPLFNAVASTWAEDNPSAAADWAKSLPEGPAQDTAEVAVASTVANQDPQEAVEIFQQEIASGKELNLVIAIADVWATTNPAETAGWISKLAEGPAKEEAAATLATVWAASDIQSAVAWSQTLGPGEMRREVIAHLGTTWGAIEPQAALGWLDDLPAADANEGITGALYSWAGTDPVGMREWLGGEVDDTLADRARQSLGDVLSETSLPDTMDLALGMTSEKARNEALARYFREWRKRDDEGALDWLQTNWDTLPESSRTQLTAEQSRAVTPK
ncbi:hypothetical protein OKA05_12565 [Luteolibacter arcticus]|uniref:Uncharacterized protein n=1 Tax=Luteolibacter arcticus TaxID=1581411 RepID=A0ABT3GIR2_9BACT|nr:hypothetical protein [Luteolibacter arcticus]MCW1923390.1 hypothetical protein [Luteolibacter arcticus]